MALIYFFNAFLFISIFVLPIMFIVALTGGWLGMFFIILSWAFLGAVGIIIIAVILIAIFGPN